MRVVHGLILGDPGRMLPDGRWSGGPAPVSIVVEKTRSVAFVFSLKTKYAAFGAGIAMGLTAVFVAGLAWVFGTGAASGPLPVIVLVAASIATVGSAASAFVYGRRLSRALDKLKHGATRITQGDYTLATSSATCSARSSDAPAAAPDDDHQGLPRTACSAA
jgi:hypothetical protein